MLVGDSGVDAGRPDRLVSEVVLYEFEADAGVEEMGRDRMPQPMTREMRCQSGEIPVAREELLDLALPQGPTAPTEHGEFRRAGLAPSELSKQRCRVREQRALSPRAAFEALHDDPPALEVDIAPGEERHLPHAQPVEVDQRKQGAISGIRNHTEEGFDFRLRQIARKSLKR